MGINYQAKNKNGSIQQRNISSINYHLFVYRTKTLRFDTKIANNKT